MANNTDKVTVFLGNFIHCPEKLRVQCLEDGFLAVHGTKIVDIGPSTNIENDLKILRSQYAEVEIRRLTTSQILIPGLIDTHIHAPQYPNAGLGYDKKLLDWLEHYTFKMEKQYRNVEFAKKVYDALIKTTISHGTTTACYFASLYTLSSIALVDAMIAHNQRGFVGKVNMTKCNDNDYLETKDELMNNTIEFIENVLARNTELVKPIITPRFALSVDIDDMLKLGALARKYDLNIQTHIAENLMETEIVEQTYEMHYADVYDRAGILSNKTILAHGIFLRNEELQLIKRRQCAISHCPESNTCLKSGFCHVKELLDFGITLGLGTDVSGGPSPSIRQAMKSALDVSIHLAFTKEKHQPLNYCDVFYMATLGGAEALNIKNKIGNFQVGKEFDALIIDINVPNGQIDYLIDCKPMEILQKFIYSGDDRNVLEVYIAGKSVK